MKRRMPWQPALMLAMTLGLTRAVAQAPGDPSREPADTAPEKDATVLPADAGVADSASGAKDVEVPDDAAIEAEIRALEQALGGGSADAAESVADQPLPADLPVALPSDI